jgi:hypothetical protein
MVVSHEIAEMIVDRRRRRSRGLRSATLIAATHAYLLRRLDNFVGFTATRHGFTFTYYICAVVKPAGASDPAWRKLRLRARGSGARSSSTRARMAKTKCVQLPAQRNTRTILGALMLHGSELGFNAFDLAASQSKSCAGDHPIVGSFAQPRPHRSANANISANLPAVNTFTAPVIPPT